MKVSQNSRLKQALIAVKMKLFDINQDFKKSIGGRFPEVNIFNFQYLSTIYHTRYLQNKLPQFTGVILDIGCGEKPYQSYLSSATQYLGVDVIDDPAVDAKMREGKYIPFPDNYFDGVISTQAIEHIEDLDTVMEEIVRVAKPNAQILISLPFMFLEHGAPEDYRRFTKYGLHSYLSRFNFEVMETKTLGGIGSYLVLGLAGGFEFQFTNLFILLKFLTLPIYVVLMPILNILGVILDRIDTTDSFYVCLACIARNRKEE